MEYIYNIYVHARYNIYIYIYIYIYVYIYIYIYKYIYNDKTFSKFNLLN